MVPAALPTPLTAYPPPSSEELFGTLADRIAIGPFNAFATGVVARQWEWDTAYVLGHFGWRAVLAVVTSTLMHFTLFRRELTALAMRSPAPDIEQPDDGMGTGARLLPVRPWITIAHMPFMTWTELNAHYPALFLGGFLFFLRFAKATSLYHRRIELKTPLPVGFFLAGLVIHGGLQGCSRDYLAAPSPRLGSPSGRSSPQSWQRSSFKLCELRHMVGPCAA